MENSPVYIDDPKNMDIELSNPASSAAPVMVEVSVKEQNTSAVEIYTVTTKVENAANVKWTLMSEDGTPIETIKVRSGINYRTQPNKHTVTFQKFYPLFKSVDNGVARMLKSYAHQRETTGSSNDFLQLRPFSNGNFS